MTAYHVFVIFQIKRNKCEKKIELKNKLLDLFFESP